MPVGAIIGGVAGLAGSLISSRNNNRAIRDASNITVQNNRETNALAKWMYGQNKEILEPSVQRGNAAGQQINALLGVGGANPTASQKTAFDQFRNSTGYQFRLNEGMDSLGANWLARGLSKSGAAAKSAMTFGQGIASDEFNNYIGALSNQQGVGLSAGSALAGVGQNYVNTVTGNNNQAASALGNAAIARANNNNALWGNLAQTAGWIGGMSSYR